MLHPIQTCFTKCNVFTAKRRMVAEIYSRVSVELGTVNICGCVWKRCSHRKFKDVWLASVMKVATVKLCPYCKPRSGRCIGLWQMKLYRIQTFLSEQTIFSTWDGLQQNYFLQKCTPKLRLVEASIIAAYLINRSSADRRIGLKTA